LAEDVRYIPNMLDPLFAQPLPSFQKDKDTFTFFNVAELTEKKGHAILLEAFALAFRGREDVRLVIGGSGALTDELKSLSFSLKIDRQVEFSGMLDRETLRSNMLAADVFVLPSLFETFGVVVIEAMSCGKPVIATVCGGPEHILDTTSGLLIESGNVEALAGAMLDMVVHAGAYDADRIRSTALEQYGPQVIGRSIEAVYLEILDKNT
jgi:glycosyltransferase involved in cell wall biosynthesis